MPDQSYERFVPQNPRDSWFFIENQTVSGSLALYGFVIVSVLRGDSRAYVDKYRGWWLLERIQRHQAPRKVASAQRRTLRPAARRANLPTGSSKKSAAVGSPHYRASVSVLTIDQGIRNCSAAFESSPGIK
jgi:hypothetical protein